MATATHGIFGYTGTLGSTISARSRREPKYSKAQQTKMIRAILSRRMMSPPSYEDVLDYVDSNVTYAENKREVLAIFGERSRKGRMITDKDMKDMYCDSLHNQCVSNGLETCQTACAECKTPVACDKAKQIKKEIKKHGRKLTHFERMDVERTKEAKRKVKKAKYSTGQVVKCREGYELQCGFGGLRKITQVKAYPDYVMYAIKGKAQGFVEEEWIVGVKGKKEKTSKEKLKCLISKFEDYRRESIPLTAGGVRSSAYETGLSAASKKEHAARKKIEKATTQILGYEPLEPLVEAYKYTELVPSKGLGIALPMRKVVKHTKQLKPKTLPERRGMTTESEIKQAVQSGAFKRETAKYHKEVERELARCIKPPKPTPTKTTKPLKKKKKGVIKGKPRTQKIQYEKKKLPKMPTAIKKALHLKTLTANQQALLRKYRFVDVCFQGKMYHITKQNVKDGKMEWYKKNGKVCLKNKR